MRKPLCLFLSMVVLCWASAAPAQDLFERALQTMTDSFVGEARLDNSGVSLRGGFEIGYPVAGTPPPALPTLDLGTLLSSLGIGDGLMRDMEKLLDPNAVVGSMVSGIQSVANDLLSAAISQLPMVVSCYAGPTICDITKHQQDLAMITQQGSVAVQEMGRNLLGGLSSKMNTTRVQRCIDDQRAPGAGGAVTTTLAEAQEACVGAAAGGIINPADGSRVSSADMIAGSLDRANAAAEIKTFAADVIGDVTIAQGATSSEPLKTTVARPQKRLHDVFEEDKTDLDTKLDAAVATVAGGGTLTAAERRELSLPGVAMPGGVLVGLAGLRNSDTYAYNSYRSKLAGNMALVKLNWKVNELQDQLDEGMLTNTELGEAEREVIVQRQERLRREMRRVVQEKELAEKHVMPVMKAVMMEHEVAQREAARRGMAAAADRGTPGNEWGRQNSLGYEY